MEERKKVLELVASGHLTIDEGDRLIDALDASERPVTAAAEPERRMPGQRIFDAIAQAVEHSFSEPKAGKVRRPRHGLPVDQIVSFASLGVSPDYVRDMLEIFDEEIVPGELTSLASLGVTVDYAREIRDLFDDLSPGGVISLSSMGVSTDYIEEMQNMLDDIDIASIIEMSSHHISPDYVRELVDSGAEDLDVREVVRRRVDPR